MTFRHTLLGWLAGIVVALASMPVPALSAGDFGAKLSAVGGFGTYANPPRGTDGTKDLDRLLDDLVELKAQTYNYLIYHDETDWQDLQRFLPMAAERGIKVWVSVMPPSMAPPTLSHFSEPFRLDYDRWAREIALLSARNPNLVAWSIDDFSTNLDRLSPADVKRWKTITSRINPKLAFVPVVYYRKGIGDFAERGYSKVVDGILFPYRHESASRYDVSDASAVAGELRNLRKALGKTPIVLMVYSSRVGKLSAAETDYVARVASAGRMFADGVQIFRHPDRADDKWTLVMRVFSKWSGVELLAAQVSPTPGDLPH